MYNMLRFSTLLLCVLATQASPLQRKTPLGSRIYNGEAAILGQFPWQAGLILRGAKGDNFCGGAIIHKEWVLTAASCANGVEGAYVFTGLIHLDDPDRKVLESIEIIQHEKYIPSLFGYNIALIRLEAPLEFDENTSAIRIADVDVEDNVEVVVSGWGWEFEHDYDTSDVLNFVSLNTIGNTDCEGVYGVDATGDGVLCANSTSEPKGPCYSDIGDPLVADFESAPVLVGITLSIGKSGCYSYGPSAYMRVPFHRQWIEEKIFGPPVTTPGPTGGTTGSPTEG